MGAKARAAIAASATALKMMQTSADDISAAFQGMYAQKKNSKALLEDIRKYCAIKYPGKNDVTAEYTAGKGGQPEHKELVRMVDTYHASKAQTKNFRESVKAGSLILKTNMQGARDAIANLDKLIVAKASKKSDTGINPIKKINAAIKTKSLSGLRAQKTLIDQAIATVNRETLAIVAYAEKKMGT